jgi:hypothetical protein
MAIILMATFDKPLQGKGLTGGSGTLPLFLMAFRFG